MILADLRFSECAYFYKLKDGVVLSDADIETMMKDVTRLKVRNYLFDEFRKDGGNRTRFSLRVFKSKNEKPGFFDHPEKGWEEIRVGYYLFIECDAYVTVLKRYASIPKCISDKLDTIDYSTILALETRSDSVFKKLSIQNLDGSDYAMRSKTYESLNLSSNVSTIGISRYFIKNVKGNNGDNSFAISLDYSRINEFCTNLTVKDICGWVRQKVDMMGALSGIPDTLLAAFAKPESYSRVYATLQPCSLLIFYGLMESLMDEHHARFYHTNARGNRTEICRSVLEYYIRRLSKAYTSVNSVMQNGGKHYYTGDNNAIEIRITKTGIRLANKTWKRIDVKDTIDGEFDGDLQNLINNYHQFNVYFTDRELVYNNRTLFRDGRLLPSVSQFVKVLNGVSALSGLSCEKYLVASPKGLIDWDAKSIFKMVELEFMPQYDYFICDDCTDEWADHIGISKNKVSFFVSKHKKSKDSASDFQDVVGQALKNLGYLSPSQGQLSAKASRWRGDYLTSSIKRFRSKKGTVQDAIELWYSNIMNPNYTREMCLVVDFMSSQTFKRQLNDLADGLTIANESALFQRLWILSSFVQGCLECGVKPVIYCKDNE